MSILLGNYEFEGPFVAQTEIVDKAGLVAVLVQTNDNAEEEFELLELVETASCRTSAARAFADFNVDGALSLAVFYTESGEHAERCRLKSEIIAEFENDEFGECCDEEIEEVEQSFSYEKRVCIGAV